MPGAFRRLLSRRARRVTIRTLAARALLVTGFLACPCHLIVTVPLALASLSGSAVGAFLAQNEGLVFGVAFAYFLGAIGIGYFLMNFKSWAAAEACSECEPETPMQPSLQAVGRGRNPHL